MKTTTRILATTALAGLVPALQAEAASHEKTKGEITMNRTLTSNETQAISREATYIPFRAAPAREEAVASLLKGAAALVHATEPRTLLWLALRADADHFAIVDFFPDAEGRAAHFAGKVAAALKDAAPLAVKDGWEKGVVANVENSRILSYAVNGDAPSRAKLATRIEIVAKAGQADALAALLAGAGNVIRETEPGTLLWYAIRISPTRFAIFDVFENEAARSAHFAGKVAAALKGKSEELVEGGWDNGVVANVRNTEVLSATW
jgi:quinol monooxygenase YgiN